MTAGVFRVTGPNSCSLKIPMICSSLNLLRFIRPSPLKTDSTEKWEHFRGARQNFCRDDARQCRPEKHLGKKLSPLNAKDQPRHSIVPSRVLITRPATPVLHEIAPWVSSHQIEAVRSVPEDTSEAILLPRSETGCDGRGSMAYSSDAHRAAVASPRGGPD